MFRIDRELISYSGGSFVGVSETVCADFKNGGHPKKPQPKAGEPEEAKTEIRRMLERVEKQATEILADAEEQARRIVEQAGSEAKALLDTARKEGFEEGARRAEREERERCRREIDGIRSLLEKIGDERDAVIDGLEDEIIGLVFDVSKKVINVQLEKDDKTYIEMIQNALGKLKREGKITVKVGPDEYRRLFNSGVAEFIVDREVLRAAITEEPYFSGGDCVVESEGETINAGVDLQLRTIALAFRSRAGGPE